jgi:hypothetical protein
MSLAVDVEIESTDTAVKRCTQALIDCGATGCFIDIEWAKLNNIPTCPLTKPIPVYNVDGTANDAGAITVRGHPSISLPPLSSPTLPCSYVLPLLTSVPSPGITPKADNFHTDDPTTS